MDRGNAIRRIGLFVAIGTWVFLLVSLASFSAEDWPAPHVFPHGPVENLCGPVGAIFAYWCYFLLGQGIFLLLLFSGVVMTMWIMRNKLPDLWLRVIGLLLLSVAFAAAVNKISPGSENGFPEGNGGILGIAAAKFLQLHFNNVGSYIILALSFMVGLVLAADELVEKTPAVVGGAISKAREIAPAIPKPNFNFHMPEFFRKRSNDAAVEVVAVEPEVEAPKPQTIVYPEPKPEVPPVVKPEAKTKPEELSDELPRYAMTSTEIKPKSSNKEKEPNVFDGLARLLTEDDEALMAAASPDQALAIKPAETITPKADPDAPASVPAPSSLMDFEYELDKPIETLEPVAAPTVPAHVEPDDPPPAAAAEVPPVEQQAVVKPAPEAPKQDLVVRMAGILQPKRTAPTPSATPVPQELGEYNLPDWSLLGDAEYNYQQSQETFVREKAQTLEQSLKEFGIDANVVEINTGPVITMYEISMAPGTKVAQITALTNDIARSLAAVNVRIVAPVPGKNTVGIEVPNAQKEKVRLKELMQLTSGETQAKMGIPLFLGKDANGEALVADLAAMPHCLIAGTTGSGKSVCINTIIMSIMYTQRPDHVKLVLFDPKVVEMAPFKEIPHLMCPVITETGKAASVLEWACEKMDERYELLAEAGVRNLAGYNKLTREELFERFNATSDEEKAKVPKHLPYIVIIIDELADLMMTSGKEVEASIVRLAQKARAVGIHLILATQRPQATVVTGLIKANMPCKIAFRVASKMDSRIVLDQNGAELLLGQGDMLYLPGGAGKPVRSQGTYIEDKEIRDSVKLVATNAKAQYEPELVQLKSINMGDGEIEKDEMFDDAVRVVLESQRGSVSLLQRKLNIGYGRASRLIELMAQAGILGDYKGSQAREVTMSLEDWDALKRAQQGDEESGMTV